MDLNSFSFVTLLLCCIYGGKIMVGVVGNVCGRLVREMVNLVIARVQY